jgi:hypothetical protein
VHVGGQGGERGRSGGGQGSHHHSSPHWQRGKLPGDDRSKAPPHPIPDHGTSYGLRYGKTHGARRLGRSRHIDHHRSPPALVPAAHDGLEVRGRPHAEVGGEHPMPRARCVPCGGERRGSSGQRACAYAGGSRASWRADGCSAGTCAWSRELRSVRGGQISGPRLRGGRGSVKSRRSRWPPRPNRIGSTIIASCIWNDTRNVR